MNGPPSGRRNQSSRGQQSGGRPQRSRQRSPPSRRQPPQRGQHFSQSPPPGDPHEGGPNVPDDSGGDNLGRRKFLVGGAGAAVLAAAGGWWFSGRGYSGAKVTVEEFYVSLYEPDWEAYIDTLHTDSPIAADNADDLRESVPEREQERFENSTASIEGLHEMRHWTEMSDAPFRVTPEEDDVSEIKEILAIISIDQSGWDEAAEDTITGDTRAAVALNGNEKWKIWAGGLV